jgi:hypothetical protein
MKADFVKGKRETSERMGVTGLDSNLIPPEQVLSVNQVLKRRLYIKNEAEATHIFINPFKRKKETEEEARLNNI